MSGISKRDKNASKLVDPDEAEMSKLENLISVSYHFKFYTLITNYIIQRKEKSY